MGADLTRSSFGPITSKYVFTMVIHVFVRNVLTSCMSCRLQTVHNILLHLQKSADEVHTHTEMCHNTT